MKRSAKVRIIAFLCLFAIVGCGVFLYFRSNVKPVVYTYCDALIASLGEECVNSAAADVVSLYQYSDFVDVMRGSDGSIEVINTSTSKVNGFVRSLALRCETALDALGVQRIDIPIGAFSGSVLLSNSGPKIGVDITFFSSVKCDFVTRFENVGVNQTRHSIFAKIDVCLNTVLPISEHELYLSNNILVAESVIVGEIPNVYVASEEGIGYLDLIP